jgi:hypothetical protein
MDDYEVEWSVLIRTLVVDEGLCVCLGQYHPNRYCIVLFHSI